MQEDQKKMLQDEHDTPRRTRVIRAVDRFNSSLYFIAFRVVERLYFFGRSWSARQSDTGLKPFFCATLLRKKPLHEEL